MLQSTEIELPLPPGRWFGKTRTLRLTDGEIYGTTAPGGLGFVLQIETPEATGQLLGTTFATFRTEEGTCFCLWSGTLEVTPSHSSEPVRVPVEHKFYVYTDGTTSEFLPIDDMERMKLSMTHDAGVTSTPPSRP
jgi:ferric-dicitrate binding protein FerR (iron transport regulator)